MGAKFLRVAEDADGSGVGGYAKEMSDDYKSKEASKVSEWVSEADIIITTALIPGIYTYIHTHKYIYIYIYACMYVFVCICVCVCVCVYTYILL